MNALKHRFTLEMTVLHSQATIHIKKHDTKNKLVISLSEHGKPYEISQNVHAVFVGKKPDGKIVFNDCVITGNTIEYTITAQTSVTVGIVGCEIRLYDDNKNLLTSPRFTVVVDEIVYDENEVEIESENEFNVFVELLSETKALLEANERGELNGKDGTSITVSFVTESTEDGGTNIVKFSDGKTLKVRNGTKGNTGATGATFTPHMTESGMLSWNNDRQLENPGKYNMYKNILDSVGWNEVELNPNGNYTISDDKYYKIKAPVTITGAAAITTDAGITKSGLTQIALEADSAGYAIFKLEKTYIYSDNIVAFTLSFIKDSDNSNQDFLVIFDSPVSTLQQGYIICPPDALEGKTLYRAGPTDGEKGGTGADGYTPVKGVDYWTEEDKGMIRQECEQFLISELASRGQLAPEFAESVEECTDTSKLYVLPDGYIYAYMQTDGKPTYTNLALPLSSDWESGSRLNASGAIASSSENGAFVSNAFTCKRGDILRVKGVRSTTLGTNTGAYFTLTLLNSSGGNVQGAKSIYISNVIPPSGTTSSMCMNIEPDANGVYTYTIGKNASDIWITSDENAIVSARVGGIATDGTENIVITINEEIATTSSGYRWANTRHAFFPADYEDRILSLENNKTVMNERVSLIENELVKKEDATGSNVKWCAMGDSITEGWVSYLNDSGSPTSKVDRANGWAAKVAELNRWELTNKAIGGTGYIDLENSDTEGVTAAWYIARNTDFTPYTLVTLAYGVNDWKGNKTLGTINDAIETPTTICGGIKATIEAILASNPHCKIVVITPLNCAGYNFDYGTEATNWGLSKSFSNNGTLEDIYEAIVKVCKYYCVDYVDMTHKSVVNRKNILSCLTDGVHPNAETHTLLAYELAKKIPAV